MCTYLDLTASTYYFRRPVPKDLHGYFTTASGKPRVEWKFSLGTKDRETAKRLLPRHMVETDNLIDEARLELSAAIPVDCPADAAQSDQAISRAAEQAEALAAVEAAKAARYTARKDFRVLARQRMALSTAELTPQEAAWRDIVREHEQDGEKLQEAVEGQRAVNAAIGGDAPSIFITKLYERYAASGSANPKTVQKWRSRVASLVQHLGHDDASRVTRADLNAWAEALIAKGLSKKTVVAGYLPAVRLTFSVAHEDEAIPVNPASGLKVRAPKLVQLRERDLTDDEAATILGAALKPQPAGLAKQHALARRWVPWLCAMTGSRVGEITQLRAMDIRQEAGDIWVLHITPEAGSVKTGKARSVPVHPQLIEQGILELAKAGDATPLF